MKRSMICLSVLCVAAGMANAVGGNLNFQIGQKGLDNDDWGKVDSQLMFGLHYDTPLGTMPFNFSGDFLMSSGEDGDLTGKTTEITVGVRKYFDVVAKPVLYGGLGLSYVIAAYEIGNADDSAGGIGFTLNGGAMYPVTEKFNIGLDLRFTSATADWSGTDVAAGGFTYSLVLGMGL